MNAQTQPCSAPAEVSGSLSDAAVQALASSEGPVSADSLARTLAEGPWLEELMNQVDGSGLRLTGRRGFLPALMKAVLEKGLAVEPSARRAYDKAPPPGRGSPN